ncbi:hypothetical protein F5Y15DRAFT_412951 [Xylariaceae sp. FL0016]|nr:hypothetical protein F5Y15DRAFT_412951 [Xylariaceae sp. FL0016]
MMVEYTIKHFNYAIDDEEANEVLNNPRWPDVDAYCEHMLASGCYEYIPGSKVLKKAVGKSVPVHAEAAAKHEDDEGAWVDEDSEESVDKQPTSHYFCNPLRMHPIPETWRTVKSTIEYEPKVTEQPSVFAGLGKKLRSARGAMIKGW